MTNTQNIDSKKRTPKRVGDKFYFFIILKQLPTLRLGGGRMKSMFLVQCNCGKEIEISGRDLGNGYKKSCYSKECPHTNRQYHRRSRTPEYIAWCAMKQRCLNPNTTRFEDYGGRGIAVCDDWKDNFLKFYEDMGNKPGKEYSLDRINVDRGYSKENCKWSTRSEQGSNVRKVGPMSREINRLRSLCVKHGVDPDQKT